MLDLSVLVVNTWPSWILDLQDPPGNDWNEAEVGGTARSGAVLEQTRNRDGEHSDSLSFLRGRFINWSIILAKWKWLMERVIFVWYVVYGRDAVVEPCGVMSFSRRGRVGAWVDEWGQGSSADDRSVGAGRGVGEWEPPGVSGGGVTESSAEP